MGNHPKFCGSCGAALATEDRFCRACGHSVNDGKDSLPTPTQTYVGGEQGPVCPRCGQPDAVARAKTIYEKELLDLRSRQWQPDSEEEATEDNLPTLAQQLAPPPEPDPPSVSFSWYLVPYIPGINILLMWFAPMSGRLKKVMIGLGVMSGISWYYRFKLEESYMGPKFLLANELKDVAGFTVLDLPFLWVMVLLIVYYTGLFLKNRQLKLDYRNRVFPEWQEVKLRWNALWYCSRCQGVFLDGMTPASAKFVPMKKLEDMLYNKNSTGR